jgi:hypothetical protein
LAEARAGALPAALVQAPIAQSVRQQPLASLASTAAQNTGSSRHKDPSYSNADAGEGSAIMVQSRTTCSHVKSSAVRSEVEQGVTFSERGSPPQQGLNGSSECVQHVLAPSQRSLPCETAMSDGSAGGECRQGNLRQHGADRAMVEPKDDWDGVVVRVPVRRAKYVPSLRIVRHRM